MNPLCYLIARVRKKNKIYIYDKIYDMIKRKIKKK